jgi:hypothetical protein
LPRSWRWPSCARDWPRSDWVPLEERRVDHRNAVPACFYDVARSSAPSAHPADCRDIFTIVCGRIAWLFPVAHHPTQSELVERMDEHVKDTAVKEEKVSAKAQGGVDHM